MRSPLSERASAAKSGAGLGVGEAVAVAAALAVGVSEAVALGDGEGITSVFVHAATIAAIALARKDLRRTYPVDLVVELAPAEVLHVVRGYGVLRLSEEETQAACPAIADAVGDERALQSPPSEGWPHTAVAQSADRPIVEQHPRRSGLTVDPAEVGAQAATPRPNERLDDVDEARSAFAEAFEGRLCVQLREPRSRALDRQAGYRGCVRWA